MDLAEKKCIPCSAGTPKLSKSQIDDFLERLDSDWIYKENPDRIIKDFEFKNFLEAIEFVNNVAGVAEEEGHHPNLSLHDYKFVTVENYTHKIGGLHENDFILASKIEKAHLG